MNKSKLLKKSLAMVLAVLMIVAMIPLGASAAEVPAVTKVMIGTETATLGSDGSTYSATISQASVATDANITVILNTGVGNVFHDGTIASASNGQVVLTPTAAEFAAKKAEFTVWDAGMEVSKKYVASWSYKPQSSDNSIVSIGLKDAKKQYGATVEENGVLTITTTYDGVTGADPIVVKVNEGATVASSVTAGATTGGVCEITNYTVGTAFTVTVTAENGSSRTYSVKVANPKYFPSFSVTGERKDTDVNETTGAITVYVPYEQATVKKGGKTYYELTTNFTTGYPSASVKTLATVYPNGSAGSEKALTSGNKLYVEVGQTVALVYSYSSATATKTFTVTVDKQAEDPKAEITALRLGNYNAKIDGKNITVELPATYMANNATSTLSVKGSTGATAQVVGTTNTTSADMSSTAFVNFGTAYDTSKETTAIIRVTSGQADDNGNTAINDYTLTVKKVGITESAQMKAFILEDGDGEQYTATFDHTANKITVAVPYSSTQADVQAWKLYYESSNGSEVKLTTGGKTINASGDTLSTDAQALIPATFDGKTAGTESITVTASNNSTKVYNLYVTKLPPETGKTITSFGVTAETAYDNLTDTNVYKGSIGSTITVEVPYSAYNKANFASNTIVPVFETSKGAKVYYLGKSSNTDTTAATALTGVTEDAAGVAITINGNVFDGTPVTPGSSTVKTLTLVVASESAQALTTFDNTWKGNNAGLFTTYKLIVKQKTANKSWSISNVELFDKLTNEKAAGSVSGTTISFQNIPNHFIADSAAGNVLFSYTVKMGETVKKGNNAGAAVTPITYNDDGTWKAGGEAVTFSGTTPAPDWNTLYIESEDGVTAKATLTMTYAFAAAEKGCEMTSMTINNVTARPDADHNITFNLPYGTEVTALKPTWVVSKFAKVSLNGGAVNSGSVALNFTGPQTFVVTSEDGQNTTTYTVTVKTDAQFSDVKTTDWFYADVMEAASKGIVYGVGNGLFQPYGKVTRGQFAQFIARVDGYKADDYIEKTPFSDVKAGTEQSAAIAYCAEKKYIAGKGDTTFAPNEQITREQMAVIVAQSMGLTQVTDPAKTFADDATISSWAKGYVYACSTKGVLSGTGNDKYSPKGVTTRAEAASVAMRISRAK